MKAPERLVGIEILLAYRGIHVLLLAFAPSGPQLPQNIQDRTNVLISRCLEEISRQFG